MSIFLILTGREFHFIAPLYNTLFLYFSHLGIIVSKKGCCSGPGTNFFDVKQFNTILFFVHII